MFRVWGFRVGAGSVISILISNEKLLLKPKLSTPKK